jgi:hypothetical protein
MKVARGSRRGLKKIYAKPGLLCRSNRKKLDGLASPISSRLKNTGAWPLVHEQKQPNTQRRP